MRSTFLALCALLSIALPFTHGAPRVARAVAANTPDAPQATARTSSSVVLRPNDVLELRMSSMPPEEAQQFSGTAYTVGGDGQVSFPYAGALQAAGRTPSELERALERTLIDKKMFRWPTATINVVNGLRYVVVGGNVRAPNRMPWSADLTLMSGIMAAGGPGDFAGKKINLIRNGAITVYRYDKLQKDPSQDPRLLPGDQVDLR